MLHENIVKNMYVLYELCIISVHLYSMNYALCMIHVPTYTCIVASVEMLMRYPYMSLLSSCRACIIHNTL